MNKCAKCKRDFRRFYIFKGQSYCQHCVDSEKAEALDKRIREAKDSSL